MSDILNVIYAIWVLIFFITFLYYIVKLFSQMISWYGVPYVPSSDFKVDKLVLELEIKKWQKFLDLWSGDWRILESIWKKYPELKLYWIENSYFPYKLSLKRKEKNKLDYTIYKKNFFKEDFSKYDVFYAFMIDYLMLKIWTKIKKECKTGTLFYSNSFQIKWEKPYKTIKASENSFIYVYKV